MFEHPFPPFAEQGEVHAEAGIGGLGAGDRLKQEIDWSPTLKSLELRCDVSQTACLSRNRISVDQSSEPFEDRDGRLDGPGGRIDPDHGIAAAEQEAVYGREQDAGEVVTRVVRLDPDPQYPHAHPSCSGSG